ncbi:MAG: hypothetical protein WBJ37_03035 [Bacteroidales bacterium]
MQQYRFTQPGTFSIAILIPVFGLMLFLMFSSGLNDTIQIAIFVFTALILLMGILLFYKITIYIDERQVYFKMGCGLISKRYNLDEIKSCKTVRNPLLYGIGLRKIPGGWLYNVSGLDAIELEFKNSRSIVRIGTNKPEEVASIINRLIKSDLYVPFKKEKEYSAVILAIIVIIFSVLLPASLLVAGSKETEAFISDNQLIIKGMYGVNIKLTDIVRVDTFPVLPGIIRRDNGYASGSTLKGRFTLKDDSKARLFVKKDMPPFINIKTDKLNIWLNFTNPDNTRRLYTELNK